MIAMIVIEMVISIKWLNLVRQATYFIWRMNHRWRKQLGRLGGHRLRLTRRMP